MQGIFSVFREIWQARTLLLSLARNDFKTRYAGSYLGTFWAFVQPIMTIMVFWFVFEVGFRTGKVGDVPYILWFSCGLIPWFFFADAWAGASNSFIEYSYLVKKVVFQISTLPLIKIISSLFVHFVFLAFLFSLFLFYGYLPTWSYLQLLYYSLCMICLVFSLGFLSASIVPFIKDVNQIISIVLQFGMWMTPIMWSYTMVPSQYHWLFHLNPMFYIVEGYRNALFYQIGFWHNIWGTISFWGMTGCFFLAGMIVFKKVRPHFADVL